MIRLSYYGIKYNGRWREHPLITGCLNLQKTLDSFRYFFESTLDILILSIYKTQLA